MSFTISPVFDLKPGPPGFPRYREDAPDCRAVLFVMPGGYGIMHDYIGELLDYELESRTKDELGADLCESAPGPGCFMWEGTVKFVTCGPYDCPDVEAEYVGTYRPLTEEEAKTVANDENPWDLDEWLTPEAVEADARHHLLIQAVLLAQQTLVDQCRALLHPCASDELTTFRWYLEQLGKIEDAVHALAKAEAERDGA